MREDTYSKALKAGIIPTPQQTLLLKACIESGDSAIDSFQKWVNTLTINFTRFDKTESPGLPQVFDQLDMGSQRLLSLLYKNLTNQGYQHTIIQKLSGYYKYIWYRNNLLKAKLAELIIEFKAAGIEVAVIKGIAQIEKYYPHYGMRPTMDIDLYVRPVNTEKSVNLLIAKGWQSKEGNPHRIAQAQLHAHTFYSGYVELDLHFHLSIFPLRSETENLMWESASLQKEGYYLLTPAYELYITMLHAFQWNLVPPVRWVTDSLNLLKQFDSNEWNRFYELIQSEAYSIPYPLFIYLVENNFTLVPERVMEVLKAGKNDKNIQMQIKYALASQNENAFIWARRVYYRLRYINKGNWLIQWLNHYLYAWNVNNYIYLIPVALTKLYRKTRN